HPPVLVLRSGPALLVPVAAREATPYEAGVPPAVDGHHETIDSVRVGRADPGPRPGLPAAPPDPDVVFVVVAFQRRSHSVSGPPGLTPASPRLPARPPADRSPPRPASPPTCGRTPAASSPSSRCSPPGPRARPGR